MRVAWMNRWLRRLIAPSPSRNRKRPRSIRPTLEWLEDRVTPTVYTVTTLLDMSIAAGVINSTGAIVGTNDVVTLRSAIQASNNNPTVGGNTIVLTDATYNLSISPTGSDDNTTGDLNILTSVTIKGAGPANTAIDGGGMAGVLTGVLDRVMTVGVGLGALPPSVTLQDLTVQGGTLLPNPNRTAQGGGILVNAGSSLTLLDVRVTDNQVVNSPTGQTGLIMDGGAIATLYGSTLNLTDVMVDHNLSVGTGGGIDVEGASSVTIGNSTLADNEADGQNAAPSFGGGLYIDDADATAAFTVLNSTIADNLGGGIAITSSSTLMPDLENTLAAGNQIDFPGNKIALTDLQGTVQSDGHNLVQYPIDSTGAPAADGLSSNEIGKDPLLAASLADNGGLLPTLALEPGSPAIDAGDDKDAAGLTTDQRGPGFARLSGAHVDIGAFEVQQQAATSTALTASPNPAAAGQTVVFTAAVTSPGGAPPDGTVSFFVDGSAADTESLQDGTATFSTADLTTGQHAVYAVYNGDTAFATSSSDAITETVDVATTTILQASPNPAPPGARVTLTAAVTASAGTATGGTVTFYESTASGPVEIGAAALVGGSASVDDPGPLASGVYQFYASYGGYTPFLASTSPAITETVQAATTTTLSASPNPAAAGQTVVFTAAVTSPGGAPPDGTVSFFVDGSAADTESLQDGTATFSTADLTTGQHAVYAVYNGDTAFATSSSDAITETVDVATTTILQASPNPAPPGARVTLTAAVTASAGTATGGTVTFYESTASGPVEIGAAALVGGSASVDDPGPLASGVYQFYASYGGYTPFLASTSPAITETVETPVPTTIQLTASPNPALVGQRVTVTATVTSASGATPLGSVSFFVDGIMTPAAPVGLQDGQASFSISTLSIGTHQVTAKYSSSSAFLGSMAGPVTVMVQIPTVTQLAVSPVRLRPGEVELTADVSLAGKGAVGTVRGGLVDFYDVLDGQRTLLGQVKLVEGRTTLMIDTATLARGLHSLTATYEGAGDFAASESAAVPLSVRQLATRSQLNVSALKNTITLTADVSLAGFGALGTVTGGLVNFYEFHDGQLVMVGQAKVVNGKATLTIDATTLGLGDDLLSAVYEGTDEYAASTSDPVFWLNR